MLPDASVSNKSKASLISPSSDSLKMALTASKAMVGESRRRFVGRSEERGVGVLEVVQSVGGWSVGVLKAGFLEFGFRGETRCEIGKRNIEDRIEGSGWLVGCLRAE